jgi:hypothetical protein
MKLQIECNNSLLQQQPCWLCKQSFEVATAKIIACDDQGNGYGEVCAQCLSKGFDWLSDRFDRLNRPKKPVLLRHSQKTAVPVSA